jgi:hypothetical protein
LNLKTFALQPHLPPPHVNEETDVEGGEEEVSPRVLVVDPPPSSISNNIISASNIILQEASSSSSLSSVGGRQFRCDVCSQNFDTRNKLYYHKRKHAVSEDRIKCPHCKCDYKKKSEHSLQKHLMNIHNLTREQTLPILTQLLQHRPVEHQEPEAEPETAIPLLQPQPQELRLHILNVSNGQKSRIRLLEVDGAISSVAAYMDKKYQSKGKLYKNNQEIDLNNSILSVFSNNDELEYRV